MQSMTTRAIVAATVLLLACGSAYAKEDGLPADRVIAAIQTAVAAHPGLITEIEVKREGNRLMVEIEIRTADGKKMEVKVDPETNAVMR